MDRSQVSGFKYLKSGKIISDAEVINKILEATPLCDGFFSKQLRCVSLCKFIITRSELRQTSGQFRNSFHKDLYKKHDFYCWVFKTLIESWAHISHTFIVWFWHAIQMPINLLLDFAQCRYQAVVFRTIFFSVFENRD